MQKYSVLMSLYKKENPEYLDLAIESMINQTWPQFSNDGHPSYSPDGSLIVTDSYPDRARIASINIMSGNEREKENTTIRYMINGMNLFSLFVREKRIEDFNN